MRKIVSFVVWCVIFVCSNVVAQTVPASNQESAKPVTKSLLRLAGPPWIPFLSEQNPQAGLATEIVVKGLEKAGYQTSVLILPWRRVLAEAKNSTVDILIGLWKTPDRENQFSFSESYYSNRIYFLGTQDKSLNYFSSLDDMKGLRIGLRKGASYGLEFDNASELNKIFVPSSLSMLKMLVLDRLDYGIGDRLILERLISNHSELRGKIVFIEPELVSLPLHMAVIKTRSDHLEIVERFNAALREMKEQGEVNAIYKVYGVE